MGERQAAKVLGVDEKQIRRDLEVRTKAAESADKNRTGKPPLTLVPPRETFERQVESDNPPTVTEPGRQGTKHQAIAATAMRPKTDRTSSPRRR
ncbi:MAG: hypothetical protein WBF43_08900 [Methylocella sp.]